MKVFTFLPTVYYYMPLLKWDSHIHKKKNKYDAKKGLMKLKKKKWAKGIRKSIKATHSIFHSSKHHILHGSPRIKVLYTLVENARSRLLVHTTV